MSTITLTTPGPRQRISIPAEPKATIHLDFQADQATLERSGDNLVFSFADGGSIAIEGFYAQYDKANLPEFAVDGKILPGSEFFNAFGPDLAPAAGPAAQAAERGGRYNEHSDSSLASGLGHLDGAENPTLNVSAPAEMATLDPTLAVTRGTGLGAIAGSGSDISGPQGPSFPSGPFVRAVLYGNGQSGEYVSTNVFFAENNGTPSAVAASDLDFTGAAPWARFSVTVTLPDGWQNAWVDVAFDYTTGRLEFRLTPEGIAEMQRLGVTGKPLVDFIQISVLDRGTGNTFDYNVELIATKDQEFDSAAHDSEYGGNIAGDNIGEFHQGQNGGGAYSIISSTKNDEIILNDTLVGGSSIHASGSADPALMADDYNTINLNGGVSNTTADSITRVTSTDGILKVQGGVSAQGDNAENFISMGKGQVHINNASGHGINAVAGENTILGRELLVNASDKGIYAEDRGSNTVETKGGDVSINAEGTGMVAENNSSNAVSATGGSVNITSSGAEGIAAYENSANTLSVSGGNVNIQSAWAGVGASDYSANTISVTNGSVNIVTDTWGITTNNNSTANIDVTNGSLGIDALGRGIHSYGESTNNVHVTNGDVNVNSGWGWDGIIAHFGGTNNVAVDNGSVVINSGGAGMTAFYDSKNDLAINNGSLLINSNYTGVHAGFGENAINVNGGDVSISSTSAYDAGVLASENGKNTITTSGTLSVSAATTGISAENGGTNSLAGNDVSITATSKDGVYAADAGSTNLISAGTDGKVEISAGGSGLIAKSGGANSVIGDDIFIKGSANGASSSGRQSVNEINAGTEGKVVINGNSYGLNASAEGKNVVNGGDITITSTGNSNSQAAVFATGNNSANTITADSDGKIVINGGWGGLGAAQQGVNNVSGGDIAITSGTSSPAVFATGSGSTNNVDAGPDGKVVIEAYYEGLNANSGGSNTVRGGDITVTGNHSAALWAVNSGSNNSIDAGSNGKIVVNGHMSAQAGGVNNLSGGNVSITGTGNSYGAYATGTGSKNTVAAGSDGTANISGSTGLYAANAGKNVVTGGDISITGTTGYAAFATDGQSKNSIDAGSGGTVSVSGKYGLYANNSGVNAVSGGNITVVGTGISNSALYTSGTQSTNTVTASSGGTVSISGDSGITAMGGTNKVTGGDITIAGTGTGSNSYGIFTSNGSTTITGSSDGTVSISGRSGLSASGSGGSNTITGGSININGTVYGAIADGVNNVNTIAAGSGGKVSIGGNLGLFANSGGKNNVSGGDVTIAGSGTGDNDGFGMLARGAGSSNTVATQSGSVVASVTETGSGSAYGMAAFASGSNRISTDSGSVVVYGIAESGESYGMVAKNAGTNSIETDSGVVMVESGSPTTSTGMWADSAGSANRITTDSGDIFLFADGLGSEDSKGMLATDSGINSIATQSGATFIAGGMHATTSGSNSVTARSGDVTIVGSGTGDSDGFGMLARGAGSSNTVATQSGSVVASVSGTDSSYAFGMAAMSSGKNRISTETGAVAVSGTGSAGTGDGYGMFANNAGGNIIETASGGVAVSSDSASRSYGMWAFSSGSKNSITTDSGSVSVDASSSANGISNGMFAENSGSNGIVSQSGSVNVIATSVGGNSYGMNAQNSGNNHIAAGDSPVVVSATSTGGAGHGMYAYSFGNSFNSNNSITTEGGAVTISGAGESGYGMHAYSYDSSSSSSNSIASAADIPLTVTITATADSAQKAIAMWADGGRAVNYITGHSQSGGAGDNITLNGGIAMQTANGGRNIITTGAGNDHVTINGAVKGSGNQINVGGGSNTVTLNGAVETGSLNVIATGGTYTLILQATSTESFAERYGQWLNNIASDGLIAGGLTSINFDGLDVANLPADFLAAFNDLLHDLHSNGISIEPAGLFDHLHDPAAAAAPMMFVGGDIAEHSNTDTIHAGASDDGQAAHAAGLGTVQGHDAPNTADIHTLDEAASVAVIGSGGTESSNPNDSTGAQDTSALGDSTAANTHPAQGHDVTGGVEPAADDVPHDALQSQDALLGTGAHPQLDTHMAENIDSVTSSTESGHEDSPVLDDLLNDHSFYGSENVGLLFHGDSLNQLDGGPASDVTTNHSGEVHSDIVLSQGDVSLDSLFGEMSMSRDEYGSMHQDGDSATNMAGMSLTDMHTTVTVDAPAQNTSMAHGGNGTDSSMIGEGANAPAWDSVQPSVENSLQETANTAMRQMEAC